MTDKFCFALLRTTALQIIQSAGFDSAHIDPTNILTDIMGQYLQLLASTTSAYAKLAGRATGNAWDVVDGLEELGVSVDTLREWLEEEGKALTPSWSEQSDPGRTLDGVVRNGRNKHEDVLVYEYMDIPDDVLEYDYSDEEGGEKDEEKQTNVAKKTAEEPIIPNKEINSLPESIPSYFPPFPSSLKKDATPPPQRGRPPHLGVAAAAATVSTSIASIAVPSVTRSSSPTSNAPAPIIVKSRKKPIDNPFTHVVPFEESALAIDKNSSLSLTLHQENEDGHNRLPEAPHKRRRVILSNGQMKNAIVSLTSENNSQAKRKQRDELAGNHAIFRKLTQNDAAPGNTMFSSSNGVLSELLHRVAPPAMVSKLSAPNLLVDVASPSQPPTTTTGNGSNPPSTATTPTAREPLVPIRSSSGSMLASLAGGQYSRKQQSNVEEITASPNTPLASALSPHLSTAVSALSNTSNTSANTTTTGTTAGGNGMSHNTNSNITSKPSLTPISLASLSAGQEPQKKKTTKLTLNISNGDTSIRTPATAPSTAESTPTSLNTPKIRFKIKPPEVKPEASAAPPPPPSSTPPPPSPPPPPSEDPEEQIDIVRCICDNPTVDYGTFMIACDECGVWYHGNCVGVEFDDNVEEWYCRDCRAS